MKSNPSSEDVAVLAALTEWRCKAFDSFMLANAVVYLPGIILWFTWLNVPLTPLVKGLALAAYLSLLASALLRRIDYRIRLLAPLIFAWGLSLIGSTELPSGPFMRALPITLPIMVLVFSGDRAARISAVVSVVVLMCTPFLATLWGLGRAPWIVTGDVRASFGLMLAQGVLLTGVLVAMMVPLERLHAFLTASLTAERQGAVKLEQEAVERAEAHRTLSREMEERHRLEREIARVSDEERHRLGQDVHDGVCQQLAGALLRCQALGRKLERGGTLTSEEMTALSNLLEEAMDEAHAVSKGLWPLESDPEAFIPALRALVRRTHEMADVRCDLVTTGDVCVGDQPAQHLYRIAQEAISNAARHAQASQITVRLQRAGDGLLLSIQDDGSGMPDELPSGGMGLTTMAYRAQILGGKLTVERRPEGGTCVLCCVPFHPARPEDSHYTQDTESDDGS